MAITLSTEQSEKIKKDNAVAHSIKAIDQADEGKSFTVPFDGHGAGVIPEEVWKNLPGKTE